MTEPQVRYRTLHGVEMALVLADDYRAMLQQREGLAVAARAVLRWLMSGVDSEEALSLMALQVEVDKVREWGRD